MARGARACELGLGFEEWKIPRLNNGGLSPMQTGSAPQTSNDFVLSSFQFCPEKPVSPQSHHRRPSGLVTCPQGLALALCPKATSVSCPVRGLGHASRTSMQDHQATVSPALPTMQHLGRGPAPLSSNSGHCGVRSRPRLQARVCLRSHPQAVWKPSNTSLLFPRNEAVPWADTPNENLS